MFVAFLIFLSVLVQIILFIKVDNAKEIVSKMKISKTLKKVIFSLLYLILFLPPLFLIGLINYLS